jgi:hypothetical protein
VGSGQDLERLDPFAVAGDEAMVVAVGADHVGQDLGVAGVGLCPAGRVTVSIPRCRQRVDRIELVAGGDEGGHEQAPVGLDPDHHLGRVIDMGADQVVEPGDAVHALRETGLGQPLAFLVDHMHVVMGLSPVHPDQDHPHPSSLNRAPPEPRGCQQPPNPDLSVTRYPRVG